MFQVENYCNTSGFSFRNDDFAISSCWTCLTKGTSEPKVMTVTLSLQGVAAVQGRHVLAIPFRHAEFISASVQTCIVAKIWIVSEHFYKTLITAITFSIKLLWNSLTYRPCGKPDIFHKIKDFGKSSQTSSGWRRVGKYILCIVYGQNCSFML